jgi:uncharacterized membrane protein
MSRTNGRRACIKVTFILAVTLCLVVILERVLKWPYFNTLKHDMSLLALIVVVLIINIVSFAGFVAIFIAWKWVSCDLRQRGNDDLDRSTEEQITHE